MTNRDHLTNEPFTLTDALKLLVLIPAYLLLYAWYALVALIFMGFWGFVFLVFLLALLDS